MHRVSPEQLKALAAVVIGQAVDDLQFWSRIHARPVDTPSRRCARNNALRIARSALAWMLNDSAVRGISFRDCAETLEADPDVARWRILDRIDDDALDAIERAQFIDRR